MKLGALNYNQQRVLRELARQPADVPLRADSGTGQTLMSLARRGLVRRIGGGGAFYELKLAGLLPARRELARERLLALEFTPSMAGRMVNQITAPDLICRVCGCIEEVACAGGCGWAEPGLCTQCETGRKP